MRSKRWWKYAGGAEAVRMRRTLTEELSFAQLQWASRMRRRTGAQVYRVYHQ